MKETDMDTTQQSTRAAAANREAKPDMNILIIDDSEDQRELTEAALRSAGYDEVRGVASANEAFKILDIGRNTSNGAAPVDIVLLDIVMPGTDGIEACAYIRSQERYEDLPIIMITSLDDMGSLASAFVAGANDYITKPVNRIELLARVRTALKLKGELEQRRERERELLNFLSSWGDRRATLWIDEATGLFVGEVAEAYLTSASEYGDDDLVSVITLAVDRLDVVKQAQGEKVARAIQLRAAKAVRATLATVGVLAASYRNGLIVIIAPDFGPASAQKLAQSMCTAIAQLGVDNREFITADHVTASAAVVTGRVKRGPERVKLLMQAIASVERSTAEGGNRVVTMIA
jgi:PleD family two-component response regulator